MNALAELINYISTTLVGVYTLLILLRFVFQWAKADFFNPISQGIVTATTPTLKPFRRFIPGFAGLDVAALALALLFNFFGVVLTAFLAGIGAHIISALPALFACALLKVMATLINIASFCLIVGIILSFVAPMSNNPAAILVQQVSGFISSPFRKIMPDLGPIDISPIFVFLAIGVFIRLLSIIGAQFDVSVSSVWLFAIVGFPTTIF